MSDVYHKATCYCHLASFGLGPGGSERLVPALIAESKLTMSSIMNRHAFQSLRLKRLLEPFSPSRRFNEHVRAQNASKQSPLLLKIWI